MARDIYIYIQLKERRVGRTVYNDGDNSLMTFNYVEANLPINCTTTKPLIGLMVWTEIDEFVLELQNSMLVTSLGYATPNCKHLPR